MTTEPLPSFRYHADPVATGSVVPSDNECVCCEQARGYIYTGPVYSEDDHEDDICPWCIADGSAHQKLGVEFTDAAGVGGYGDWDDVPTAVSDEVACRTPGFTGWQDAKWFTCCKDGACFIGRAGYKELLASELARSRRLEWNRHWTARSGKNTSKDSIRTISRLPTCSGACIVRRSAVIATSRERPDRSKNWNWTKTRGTIHEINKGRISVFFVHASCRFVDRI